MRKGRQKAQTLSEVMLYSVKTDGENDEVLDLVIHSDMLVVSKTSATICKQVGYPTFLIGIPVVTRGDPLPRSVGLFTAQAGRSQTSPLSRIHQKEGLSQSSYCKGQCRTVSNIKDLGAIVS